VNLLNKKLQKANFKRIPASGAMGTLLGEPALTSDVKGKVEGISQNFRIEAKVGYGGSKQLTLKKEWLDKIADEAAMTYDIPLLMCRFSGSRSGVENFAVMDLEVLVDLLNLITAMSMELNELYGKEK